MIKHLNNKGYMLVEIILASVIAMGVAFFITDLTLKLKNKNDDLLVKTLVYTDQAIIYNEIAEYLYESPVTDIIPCYDITNRFIISETNNTFTDTVTSFKLIVSKYAQIGNIECSGNPNDILIKVPLKVKQLENENFDVVLKFRK